MSPAAKRSRDADAALPPAERVAALRALMAANNYAAFIIPSEDAHMSEYVASCDCRRAYMTDFDGSAGVAVVTADKALCWTDGRYFVQAEAQLAKGVWKMMRVNEDVAYDKWIAENVEGKVGVDGATVSVGQFEKIERRLGARVEVLRAGVVNLVDEVWAGEKGGRPEPPKAEVFLQQMEYAGQGVGEKLSNVREAMAGKGVTRMLVAGLDETAWLLNLRGSDVEYNPVFWSYVLVGKDEFVLFCEESRFGDGVKEALAKESVTVRGYGDLRADLAKLGEEEVVWIDPAVCNVAMYKAIVGDRQSKDRVVAETGPIPLAKAKKNNVELDGARRCHIRDAVAVVKFLTWLEDQVVRQGKRPTECEAADKLDGLRAEQDLFVSLSFPTISSSGSNGAVIHYRPMPETCGRIDTEHVYLVDSGGQYRDGTTDITRTMHFGTPTAWQKECFTRVLRGHIALDSAVFPEGTTGHVLDAFARKPLWEVGLDYKHGTGHGVGSALCVHEGPHMLSFKPAAQATPLDTGFLSSNEPGYYENGGFGIRIENVMAVVVPDGDAAKRDKNFLGFETLTFVPMQHSMMVTSLMSKTERAWVDSYHVACREKLEPLLQDDPESLAWLLRSTEALTSASE